MLHHPAFKGVKRVCLLNMYGVLPPLCCMRLDRELESHRCCKTLPRRKSIREGGHEKQAGPFDSKMELVGQSGQHGQSCNAYVRQYACQTGSSTLGYVPSLNSRAVKRRSEADQVLTRLSYSMRVHQKQGRSSCVIPRRHSTHRHIE